RAFPFCGKGLIDETPRGPRLARLSWNRMETPMGTLLQDLRIVIRQLAGQKAFAAVVVATLALAIGVNTLTFSFVNFFVFRPIPMKDVSRQAMIFAAHPEHGRDRTGCSYADFVEW